MIATRFFALFVALLVVVVSAADHEHHWSRRTHRSVARSKAVVAQVERVAEPKPRRKALGRRSCKVPPSNSTASATNSGVLAVSATSAPSSASTPKASPTKSEEHSSSATKTSTSKSTSTGTSSSGSGSGNDNGSSGSGGGALSLDALFPMGTPDKSWTTSPKSSDALPLSDSTLKPTKLISALSHTYMAAPDGKQAMRAIYTEGSWTFGHDPQGGLSFYALGPDSLDMTSAKELTLGYSVFFQEGFDFNKGGKLPGLYGGNSAEVAVGCSGGRRSTECYSTRLMWRTDGAGEVYSYLPDYEVSGFSANKRVCNIPPFSDCNPTYGASIGRGAFTFPTGKWTTVSQRVRLNDVGKANGEIQLFVNGESVINVSGVILRDSDSGRHRGIQMQTFFGGSTSDWASPKTQDSYFSDFSVAITESL